MSPASSPPSPAPKVWLRSVREFPNLVHLAPPACRAEDSLAQVVTALSNDPGARSVFVIDAEDKLLGAIPEHILDRDLITAVLPQELWSSVHDMDTRELVRAAKGKSRTARELMTKARSVEPGTTLMEAVSQMAKSSERVVALVDEHQRLLGYLALFEVLIELSQARS